MMRFVVAVAFAGLMAAQTLADRSTPVPKPGCVRPEYPREIRNVEGWVNAEVAVSAEGTVTDVQIKGPAPAQFAESARSALRQWTFEPAIRRGQPVAATFNARMFFTPPDGFPLQFGVTPADRKHLTVQDATIAVTNRVLSSMATFGDAVVRGEVRVASKADVALAVRHVDSPPETSYRVHLLNTMARGPATGTIEARGAPMQHVSDDTTVATEFTSHTAEWQSFALEYVGDTLKLFLGGRLAETVSGLDPTEGHIDLDVSGGPAELRNVRVIRKDHSRDLLPLSVTEPDVVSMDVGGMQAPILKHEKKPSYSPDAMARKVEGVVELEAIVETDGSIGPIRITKSLDPDLDISAIRAIRQWKFQPAMRNGTPVRCVVDIELSFRR